MSLSHVKRDISAGGQGPRVTPGDPQNWTTAPTVGPRSARPAQPLSPSSLSSADLGGPGVWGRGLPPECPRPGLRLWPRLHAADVSGRARSLRAGGAQASSSRRLRRGPRSGCKTGRPPGRCAGQRPGDRNQTSAPEQPHPHPDTCQPGPRATMSQQLQRASWLRPPGPLTSAGPRGPGARPQRWPQPPSLWGTLWAVFPEAPAELGEEGEEVCGPPASPPGPAACDKLTERTKGGTTRQGSPRGRGPGGIGVQGAWGTPPGGHQPSVTPQCPLCSGLQRGVTGFSMLLGGA